MTDEAHRERLLDRAATYRRKAEHTTCPMCADHWRMVADEIEEAARNA